MSMLENPYRTAAPYCAPGEIEPEVISDTHATERVLRAIQSDGYAYGKPAQWWINCLIDELINNDTGCREIIRRCHDLDAVQRTCGEIANEWGYGDD